MKPNPLLDEIWRIKDELAREAGYDVHRLCDQTRDWTKAHAYDGPLIRDAGTPTSADAARSGLCAGGT